VQHLPGWATAEHAPVARTTRPSQLVTRARLCNSRAGESAAAPVLCAKGVALVGLDWSVPLVVAAGVDAAGLEKLIDGEDPRWPTFGVKVIPGEMRGQR